MASHDKLQAEKSGMNRWKGLHVGMVACYRNKERHAMWRYGRKKSLRRARRRLERHIIHSELNSNS